MPSFKSKWHRRCTMIKVKIYAWPHFQAAKLSPRSWSFLLWFLLCNYLLLESQSSCSLCPMPLLFAEHLAKGDQIEVKNRNGIRLYMSCKCKLAQTKTLKAVKVRELVQPHEPARAHGHSRPVLSNWPSISMQNLAEAWHWVAECKKILHRFQHPLLIPSLP